MGMIARCGSVGNDDKRKWKRNWNEMDMVSVICSGWDDGSIRSDKNGRWKMI